MNVSTVTSNEAMFELRGEWCELAESHRNPLLDYDWFDSSLKTLHRDDSLRVMVMRNGNGEALAIAPLVKTRKNSEEWIELIGTSRLHEPSGLLYRDYEALQSLYRSVARLSEPVILGRIPEDPKGTRMGPRQTFRTGVWLRAESAGTQVLELEKGWEDFFKSMSARRRADHRRATKRAQSLGKSKFEIHRPDSEHVLPLLEIAFEIEDRSWKGANGSSLKCNELLAAFIKNYATRAASQGTLRIFIQNLGESPAAMAICIEKYDALWFLKIGYDESFKNYSPGILQLMNIIAYCCENRVSRLEHLGAHEPWLTPWTTRVNHHVSHIHYSLNGQGIRMFSRDLSRAMRSRVSRVLPSLGRIDP